jgi:hypothetical protein
MMGPLSVTASILAVIQAASAIVSICHSYSKAAKDSPWELQRVLEYLESLRAVLKPLETIAERAESSDDDTDNRLPTLKRLCQPEGALSICFAELKALKEKLAAPRWDGMCGIKGQSHRAVFVLAIKRRRHKKDT